MLDETSPEVGEPKDGADVPLAPEEPTEVTPERTRESEIKANFEFWNQPFWEKRGVKVSEQEIKDEFALIPEKKGYNWFFYIPEGVKNTDMWQLIQTAVDTDSMIPGAYYDYVENPIVRIDKELDRWPLSAKVAKGPFAVVTQYRKEGIARKLSGDPYKKVTFEGNLMPPIVWMMAWLRWFKETRDPDFGWTVCPSEEGSDYSEEKYKGFGKIRNPILEFYTGWNYRRSPSGLTYDIQDPRVYCVASDHSDRYKGSQRWSKPVREVIYSR